MVQTCSAYGCKNRYHKDKDISFHKFPLARPDICGKWVAAMRRNNFKPTKYSNICSQHFTKDCFKRECNNRVLKENAVPSLFDFNLDIKVKQSECLEDPFPSEIHFPLSFPLTSDSVMEEVESEPVRSPPDIRSDTVMVSCDHNYTAEDSARQKKRIQQLEEQLELLRKKLKTTQQKCRRQERQLKSLRVSCKTGRAPRDAPTAFSEGYVILPKHIYHTLKGIK
ncbi:THAP domain-containing protein 1 isoform X1 [Syngnathus scovelli]|uniref:THAP domain-containing protein 1 isoform X1 n=1 Tax=Syngnathus scovelli TaxID=161590 RepID=UPI00210F8A34|nr:THAP domain-containing protein 1 isoform X1 [Syngnathus scovelli]